jgi:hypothetical protein
MNGIPGFWFDNASAPRKYRFGGPVHDRTTILILVSICENNTESQKKSSWLSPCFSLTSQGWGSVQAWLLADIEDLNRN